MASGFTWCTISGRYWAHSLNGQEMIDCKNAGGYYAMRIRERALSDVILEKKDRECQDWVLLAVGSMPHAKHRAA